MLCQKGTTRGLSSYTAVSPWQAMEDCQCGSGTGCAAVQCMSRGWCSSFDMLQRMSAWHQRCLNCSVLSLGCLPLSQWLSTPALSLISVPTSSQSWRICCVAAASTRAAMRVAAICCSSCARAVQYAAQSCAMTSSLRRCQRLLSSVGGLSCHLLEEDLHAVGAAPAD